MHFEPESEPRYDLPATPIDDPPFHPDAAGPLPRKGYRWVAWLVILLVIAVQLVATSLLGSAPVDPEASREDPIGEMVLELQSRYLVGANQLDPSAGPMLLQGAESLDVGPVGHRQRLVVLTAELAGPDAAHARLAELNDLIDAERQRTAGEATPFELTEEEAAVQEILAVLYPAPDDAAEREPGDGDATEVGDAGDEDETVTRDPGAIDPSSKYVDRLDDDQRALLESRLGWFGRLAINPSNAQPPDDRRTLIGYATKTFGIIIGAVIGWGAAFVGGLIGLGIMLTLAYTGRLRSWFASSSVHDGIYAETFAWWLVLFFGLQMVAGGVALMTPGFELLVVFVAFMASLAALVWPVLRGVPWGQVRQDVGLTLGPKPLVEPLIGIIGYAMTLPILAVGVVFTLVLMFIDQSVGAVAAEFDVVSAPAHPIILDVAGGNPIAFLQILLLGSVAAPIVEETMFRGVLYRHIRDMTRGTGFVFSVIASCALNAFVFAIIHPQGYVAVPALMGLAIGFSLVREWRGTLIPAIVMHGVSNGLVLSLVFAIM